MASYETILHDPSVQALGASSLSCGRYFVVAAYALVVYDWFLSLRDEFDLITTARWTVIKAGYLICRYYPIMAWPFYVWAWVGNHPMDTCALIVRPLYICFAVFQLSAQGVLLLRAYAFTGRDKLILAILLTFFLCLAGGDLWLFGWSFILVEEPFVMFGESGCYANELIAQTQHTASIRAGIIMILSFTLDFIILLLVIGYCIRVRSTQGTLGRIFVLQGVGAFLLISAFTLLSAVLYFGQHREYDGLALPFMLVSDVLACKIILALRRVVTPTESEMSRLQSQLVREEIANAHLDIEPQTPPDLSISGCCSIA